MTQKFFFTVKGGKISPQNTPFSKFGTYGIVTKRSFLFSRLVKMILLLSRGLNRQFALSPALLLPQKAKSLAPSNQDLEFKAFLYRNIVADRRKSASETADQTTVVNIIEKTSLNPLFRSAVYWAFAIDASVISGAIGVQSRVKDYFHCKSPKAAKPGWFTNFHNSTEHLKGEMIAGILPLRV